jgi:hypothetical protein
VRDSRKPLHVARRARIINAVRCDVAVARRAHTCLAEVPAARTSEPNKHIEADSAGQLG